MSYISRRRTGVVRSSAGIVGLLLVASCSSGGSDTAATTTAEATTTVAATTTTTTPAATTTAAAGGDATLDAPAEVGAGEKFDVAWTGPAARGDFVTIVAAGTTAWTNEPWFYTADHPDSGSLVAPITDGAYQLWYVAGDTDDVLASVDITVTPFEGALGGPAEVQAGTEFDVSWNGPDGPGDYVTIIAADAAKWAGEPYFYTADANPGSLVAPIEPGDYELRYITGADDATMATRPIVVTPMVITLDAPESVQRGSTFEVTWTGPDGPGDYITIVPADSPEGAYLSYAYTADGDPVTLTAPDEPGAYEIWYASDRVPGTFATIDILVT